MWRHLHSNGRDNFVGIISPVGSHSYILYCKKCKPPFVWFPVRLFGGCAWLKLHLHTYQKPFKHEQMIPQPDSRWCLSCPLLTELTVPTKNLGNHLVTFHRTKNWSKSNKMILHSPQLCLSFRRCRRGISVENFMCCMTNMCIVIRN